MRRTQVSPGPALLLGAGLLGTALLGTGCSAGSGASPAASSAVSSASSAAAVPSPSSSGPAATGTAGPNGEPRGFTLVATGDVLLHPQLWEQATADAARAGGGAGMDFAPMLAPIEPLVAGADLALCHLETPLAGPDGPFRGYPLFSGPPQIVPALAATGYDACSTASNHTFDQGAGGIDRTLDALDAAGIAHTGSARDRAEAGRSVIVTANGVKVGLLSFAYGFNGRDYPGGDRWRANVIDEKAILAAAALARRRGAEVVVLSLHWGTEYVQRPSAQQLDLAPRLARSADIDVIISHHAHVVEPVQKVGRTWVVYGLGNLLAWHSTPGDPNAEGLLVRFTFAQDGDRFAVRKAEYEPLLVARRTPVRVLDVPRALADRDYGSSTRSRLQEALDRTTRVVGSLGAADDGLVPITG